MDKRIHNQALLVALLGIILLAATPLICELDRCCPEDNDPGCTIECDANCCAVAISTEAFDGLPVLEAIFSQLSLLNSALPQGILPLPERPPIAAC